MDDQNMFTIKPYKNGIGRSFYEANIPLLRLAEGTQLFQAGLGCNQKRFDFSNTSSFVAHDLCGDKEKTNVLLNALNFPIPKSFMITSADDLEKIFDEAPKPFVIKPTDLKHGSGITTNITTKKEALDALTKALDLSHEKSVILQEHVTGDDHRILMIGGKFVASLKRMPASVIGDGISNIEDLLHKENELRSLAGSKKKKIEINAITDRLLGKDNLSLKSIIKKDREIVVSQVGNISSGGTGHNTSNQTHPSIITMCEKICACLDLEVAGIDILTNDISRPLNESDGKITEVNTRPDLEMHMNPTFGDPYNAPAVFVKHLFEDSIQSWIPISRDGLAVDSQEKLNDVLFIEPKSIVFTEISGLAEEKEPKKPLIAFLLNKHVKEVIL